MTLNKQQATEAGRTLLKRMKGKGWRLRVWENLDWHYCVYLKTKFGQMNVHTSEGSRGRKDGYFTLLDEAGGPGGLVVWGHGQHHTNPNVAVQLQIEVATKYVNSLVDIVDSVREAILKG